MFGNDAILADAQLKSLFCYLVQNYKKNDKMLPQDLYNLMSLQVVNAINNEDGIFYTLDAEEKEKIWRAFNTISKALFASNSQSINYIHKYSQSNFL